MGRDEREGGGDGEKSNRLPLPMLLIFRIPSQFRSLRVSFWKRLLRKLLSGLSEALPVVSSGITLNPFLTLSLGTQRKSVSFAIRPKQKIFRLCFSNRLS